MMVSAWVKYPTSPDAWQTVYSESNRYPSCIPFHEVTIDNGTLTFAWRDDADVGWQESRSSRSANSTPPLWHYITLIQNADVDSFFFDGDYESRSVNSNDRGATTLTVAAIGALCRPSCSIPSSDYFLGPMDEVRIQNRGRDPAWIRLSYETQKPGATFVTVQAN